MAKVVDLSEELAPTYAETKQQIETLKQKIAKKHHALDNYQGKAKRATKALNDMQAQLDILLQKQENIELKIAMQKLQKQQGISNGDLKPKEMMKH